MRKPDFTFYPFPALRRLGYFLTDRACRGDEDLKLIKVFSSVNDFIAAQRWTSIDVFVGSKHRPPETIKLHFVRDDDGMFDDFFDDLYSIRLCARMAIKFFKLRKDCKRFNLYVR